MWAGAIKRTAHAGLFGLTIHQDKMPVIEGQVDEPELITRYEMVSIDRQHTPALLKIIDEIMVNASDVAKDKVKKPKANQVSYIDFKFNAGRITVTNDGAGIEVAIHAQATSMAGHTVYRPEVAFAIPLAGTNITKEITNVKGGTNGLGAKIACAHSEELILETVDRVSKIKYRQRFLNRLNVIETPTLTPVMSSDPQYTRVEFMPAYTELDYPTTDREHDFREIECWMRLRACQIAAYLPDIKVTFNDWEVPVHSPQELAAMTTKGEIITCQVKAAKGDEPWSLHPWQVAAVVLPVGSKVGRLVVTQNMAIINGVVSNRGSHIDWLRGKIKEAVAQQVSKYGRDISAEKSNNVLSSVKLYMTAPIPGADWGGQRKDELALDKKTLSKYTIPQTFLTEVAKKVCIRLMATQGKLKAVEHGNKYAPATLSKSKSWAVRKECMLLVAEGDSAKDCVTKGLGVGKRTSGKAPRGKKATLQNERAPSFDWCGVFSLGGVPMNAMREASECENEAGDKLVIMNDALKNNKRLMALLDAMGLQPFMKYESEEEIATLKYGKMILFVDQDDDGVGKIAPLVLAFIYKFWPALLHGGFVGRFITPLIRMYPTKKSKSNPHKVLEFTSNESYDEYIVANPDWKQHYNNARYYKGLATHDPNKEVPHMFKPKKFRESIYVYVTGPDTDALFNVYYGDDASLRRAVLRSPVRPLFAEEVAMLSQNLLPITKQMEVESKTFKQAAIHRQIPNIMDGMLPVRRKIVEAATHRLSEKEEIKVFQLGGSTADKMKYHHGDMSLNGSIFSLAQSHLGCRLYPLLVPTGNVGSRANRGHGAARYVGVRRSPMTAKLFPADDSALLTYSVVDGEEAEPIWYVPVLPLAIMESNKGPSEGWAPVYFGRKLTDVLCVVHGWIDGDPDLRNISDACRAHNSRDDEFVTVPPESLKRALERYPLELETRGFESGEIRLRPAGRDRHLTPHFVGKYVWHQSQSMVHITELPPGVVIDPYVQKLLDPDTDTTKNHFNKFIKDVEQKSTNDEISIYVYFLPGKDVEVSETYGDEYIDPFESFLGLHQSTESRLTFVSPDGCVITFSDYLTAAMYWVSHRADFYAMRMVRERTIHELHVELDDQILKFIPRAQEHNLAKQADENTASALLEAAGYTKLAHTVINRPERLSATQLVEQSHGDKASYDYLLRISQSDLTAASVARIQARRAKRLAEIDRCNTLLAEQPTPCATLWKKEIEDLTQLIDAGISTSWTFDHSDPFGDSDDDE